MHEYQRLPLQNLRLNVCHTLNLLIYLTLPQAVYSTSLPLCEILGLITLEASC